MKIFPLFYLALISTEAFGQRPHRNDSTNVNFGANAFYGFIIPHRQAIRPLVSGTNPWGFSAEVSRLRYTHSSWNACNCYSQNGLAVLYFNFDHRVLGSASSLILFAEPHVTLGNFNLLLRAGLGPTYLSKVYDAQSNPENVLFSSRLSGILLVQLAGRLWLTDHLGIKLSAAYHHISNGGSQQPNLGINFPTFSIGAEYRMDKIPLARRKKMEISDRSMRYYTRIFFTTARVSSQESEREVILGVSGGAFKPFARMHGIGVGLEFVYDWSLKERNRRSVDNIDHRIVSGVIEHHLLFGKFDFTQAIGFYLHKKYPTPDEVFQRYSLNYKITKHLELGFSLKAHVAVAEQMDVRIGYIF